MRTLLPKYILIFTLFIQIISQPIPTQNGCNAQSQKRCLAPKSILNDPYLQKSIEEAKKEKIYFNGIDIDYVRKTERKRGDSVRHIVQPYLEDIFMRFEVFNRPIKLYVVKEDYRDLGVDFQFRQNQTDTEVYMSENFEKLLSYIYWDLFEDKEQAKSVINRMIALFINKDKTQIINFISQYPNLPLQLKKLLNPSYNFEINDTYFDFSQDRIGIQILRLPFIVKRERAQGDVPDRKIEKFNLDFLPLVLEKLDELRKIVVINILSLTTLIERDLHYRVEGRGKKWSQKELETVYAQYKNLPEGVREKGKVEKLVRQEKTPSLQGDAQYMRDALEIAFRGSGAASHLLSITHEFTHSLQEGTIENLKAEWNRCRYKDRFFPTSYSCTAWDEDMAEAMALYVNDPLKLKLACPNRYEYLKKIFFDKEYFEDVVIRYKHKGVEYAAQRQNMTLINYFLEQKLVTIESLLDNKLWLIGNDKFGNELIAVAFTKNISLRAAWEEMKSAELGKSRLWKTLYYFPEDLENLTKIDDEELDYGGEDSRTFLPPVMILVARGDLKQFELLFSKLSKRQKEKVLTTIDPVKKYTLLKQALFDGKREMVRVIIKHVLELGLMSADVLFQLAFRDFREREYGNMSEFMLQIFAESLPKNKHELKKLLLQQNSEGRKFLWQIIVYSKNPELVELVLKAIGDDEELLEAAIFDSKPGDWNAVKLAAEVARSEKIVNLLRAALQNNPRLYARVFDKTTCESVEKLFTKTLLIKQEFQRNFSSFGEITDITFLGRTSEDAKITTETGVYFLKFLAKDKETASSLIKDRTQKYQKKDNIVINIGRFSCHRDQKIYTEELDSYILEIEGKCFAVFLERSMDQDLKIKIKKVIIEEIDKFSMIDIAIRQKISELITTLFLKIHFQNSDLTFNIEGIKKSLQTV